MKVKSSYHIWILILAAAVVLCLSCGDKGDISEEETSDILFPSFKAVDQNGQELSHKDIANGVSVVSFVTSWCVTCPGELLKLEDIRRAYGKHKISVIAMTYEKPENFKELIDSLHLEIPIVKIDTTVFKELQIDAIPTRILLNDLEIKMKLVGSPHYREDRFRENINEILGISPEDGKDSIKSSSN